MKSNSLGVLSGAEELQNLPQFSTRATPVLYDEPSKSSCRTFTMWSRFSYMAIASFMSFMGALAAMSVFSVGSVLSVGSAASALSAGSATSVLSIASVNSVLSIGCVGEYMKICFDF